ncbi:hypothetical protein DRE_04309 [Drechslerella stenobrocha 248]|uniref:Uncharacterized protein n=1 Tax=Drechslerella stenobrocha 248 TaxID=1043628 RepID=W7HQD1_9PEZI|nr:hypothetical protein DRE_04309 [Drechslerella stenobrocha 248]
MDYFTKKTTHQIIPLFSGLWTSAAKPENTSNPSGPNDEPSSPVATSQLPNGNGSGAQQASTPSSPTEEDATLVPLPLSPGLESPEISKAPSRKRRRTRSLPPSKVFLLRAPGVKRREGKKNRLAASDVTVHFPKIQIDKGMPEDMQERLVDASNASDLDLEG